MQSNTGLTEDIVQQQVIEWVIWKYPNILFHHSPNEGKRSFYTGQKLRRMGLKKGFPDLVILEPNDKYHGLFIELKKDKKSYPTPEQKIWIQALNNRGYYAKVCKGFDEATKTIDDYFSEVI